MLHVSLPSEQNYQHFDFNNMFARLKKKYSHQPPHTSIQQFQVKPNRASRPKSVDVVRTKLQYENKPMHSTLYGKNNWNKRNSDRHLQARRCITENNCDKATEQSTKSVAKKGIQFKQINYNCLKKIQYFSQQFGVDKNCASSKKIEIGEQFTYKNPQNCYKTKTLKSLKRKYNFRPSFKEKDLAVRIQGHKLI